MRKPTVDSETIFGLLPANGDQNEIRTESKTQPRTRTKQTLVTGLEGWRSHEPHSRDGVNRPFHLRVGFVARSCGDRGHRILLEMPVDWFVQFHSGEVCFWNQIRRFG